MFKLHRDPPPPPPPRVLQLPSQEQRTWNGFKGGHQEAAGSAGLADAQHLPRVPDARDVDLPLVRSWRPLRLPGDEAVASLTVPRPA